MTHHRSWIAVCAGGALVLAGANAAAASTTALPSARPGGTIHLYATDNDTARSPILVTGAIGDYGTVTSVDRSGRPDENGNYVRVVLRKGSFTINATALNNGGPPLHVDRATCSAWGTVSASLPLSGGTGRYRGITGITRVTDTFAVLASRYPSGAKKGQCSRDGRPQSQYSAITGVGTVHFR